MSFKEELLHYIWKYKRFDHINLKTTDGHAVYVEHYGIHNHGSGPDFHNGKVAINNTKWAGNIEMHIKASDWNHHRHQHDKAYDNVILHVVYENDAPVLNSKGQEIPTLELNGRIEKSVIENYQKILANSQWIPCQDQLKNVDSIVINQAIDNALIQRLQRKSESVLQSLKYNNMDWNKVFFEFLAIGLGAKINKKPFEQLARITPLDIVAKLSDNIILVEALLFGQAGFLVEEPTDDYQAHLQKEYQFLQHKYKLEPMKKEAWQFSGLRPASFPHVRIAQFAKILSAYPKLFSQIKETTSVDKLKHYFDIKLKGYWMTHYNFQKESKPKGKSIGKVVQQNLLINCIVPVLFTYADLMREEERKNFTFSILQSTGIEKNNIISKWQELGVKRDSAYDSQGLLELKNECCTFKKCLSCPIGVGLLNR